MARPVLRYTADREERGKRGREARERLKSGEVKQQTATRPTLTYIEDAHEPSSFKPISAVSNVLSNPTVQRIAGAINEAGKIQTEQRQQALINQGMPSGVDMLRQYQKENPREMTRGEWLQSQREHRKELSPELYDDKGVDSFLTKWVGEPLATASDWIGSLPGVPNIQRAAGEASGVETSTAPLTGGVGGKIADVFGTVAGYAANPAQLENSLLQGGYKAAGSLMASRAGQGVTNPLAQRAATGAVAGGIEGANRSLIQGNSDFGDVALGAAAGAAFGAGGDAAASLIGRGAKALADRTGLSNALGKLFNRNGSALDNASVEEIDDILALPLGREQPGVSVNVLPRGEEPILGGAGATKARIQQRTNPWRDRYNELIGEAHNMKFTPGRELEELDSLWSQMARREDPSLDELIKLAHPTYFSKVEPGLVNRAKQLQSSRLVAGAPSPVRTAEERLGVAPNQPQPMPEPPRLTRSVESPPIQPTVVRNEPTILPEHKAPLNQNPTVTSQPVQRSTGQQTRGFADTLMESEKPPQGFKERLKSAYTPASNEQTLATANKRINKDVEEATSYVLGNSRFTAEKATVAQRLIDHYNSQGNFQRAVDVAQKVSEEATRAGQSIQALSMFNRLTAEGVLIHAQRIAKKTNEAIPLGAKEVKVTPEMAANITGLAQVTQKMTGVSDLANDVTSILERAKAGQKLSDTETQLLKRFVNESKQFVQETTKKPKAPRPPQQPKDKRVRDNVISFLDAQERAAKERLRARGIRVSSTPLDIWADYAIIGAAKMGKGTIKFADWSEQMVKDLGEEVRPHLQNLYERSREAFESSTKKVSQQTIDKAENLTEKAISNLRLAPAEADSLRVLARKVSSLSGEEKRIASQDLQGILQTLNKSGFLKKVSTTQTIGQLLNPKTQVRNALGNELFYRLERLNKLVSTPIDMIRSKITGGERTVTFKTNNQGEYWKNWMRGLKAGWKGVNVNGLETQYDLGGQAFKSKYNPLTYLEKSLGAALKSFDTAAYMRAYNNTIGELATLRAINEGQAGNKELISRYIRESDDNIMKIADEYGRYVTFQDNNIISKGLVSLKKGLNFKQDFGIGDLVLKYPKTPGALLMRALEYSPAGFLRSAAILARPIFKQEPNTSEMTQALARAIIGSAGLSGMGYFLLDKGVITGAASKDRDIRDLQKSAGQGQYQVNLSALMRLVKNGFDPEAEKIQKSDLLYTYDWMQPVSIGVSLGANVRKNIQEGTDKFSGLAGTAYSSLEGGLGTLTEQSVLSGLKSAAEGYPGQTVTDKIMDILSDVPSSFVPTAFNQANQIMDNNRRETYSPNKLEQSLNKAKAKVPGLAQDLPQQYDTLGRPKQAYQDNNWANVLLNPGFPSRYQLSPEAEFIVDLINETGDQTLAPRAPSKSITIDGQSVKLDGDMFSRYQQLLGEETRTRISKINPDASLKTRMSRTEKALDSAGKEARSQLKKEMVGR